MVGYGGTDLGKKRENNEDNFFVNNNPLGPLKNLYIIADGLGGHNAGEVASSLSIQHFCDFVNNNNNLEFTQDYLADAIKYANTLVYHHSLENKESTGMGTTFTCCSFDENNLYFAHAGDSRLYIMVEDNLIQLTTDNSVLNELLAQGHSLSEIQERKDLNSLTRALGTEANLKTDKGFHPIKNIKKVLLCSDGLSDIVKDKIILEILQKNDGEESIQLLIDKANELGGYDNISVIVLEKGVKGNVS